MNSLVSRRTSIPDGFAIFSLQQLWLMEALPCDCAPHDDRNIKTALTAAHLNAESFWW